MSKRKVFFRLLVLCVVAGGAVAVWWTGFAARERTAAAAAEATEAEPAAGAKRYTATAYLSVAPRPSHLMTTVEKFDLDEFDVFRNTQATLIRQRFVLMAALRNPKMKALPSVLREDARHNAVTWLTSILRVNLEKKTSVITVSATLPDADEAATIVNAVVNAYFDEVVNRDEVKRRDRLDSLTQVAVQKEEEVRKLREDMKREMETMGTGDEETIAMRRQMAANVYMEYLRELQTMRQERVRLQGRLQEAVTALKELGDAKIPRPRRFSAPFHNACISRPVNASESWRIGETPCWRRV